MKIRNTIITMVLFGLLSNMIYAQNPESKKSNIYDFNHFSFEFQTGLNRTQFIRDTGLEEFEYRIENVHLLTTSYQFNFGKHFGLEIRGGFGLQPYIYGFETRRMITFFEGRPNVSPNHSSPFTRFGLSGNYHHQFNNSKWGIDASLGGAFSIYFGGQANLTVFAPAEVDRFELNYEYKGLPVVIIPAGIGLTRELNNRDLVGLYLSGEYYFNSIIKGTYNFPNAENSGRILNSGSNIGLKLKYSFTTAQRKDKITGLLVVKKNTRIAKQEYKKEKRNTKTENMYLTVGSGVFYGRNITRGTLDQIRSSTTPSWNHYVRFENGLLNNYFFEGSASIEQYYSSIHLKDIVMVNSNDFVSSTVSIGYGRRFIRKKTNWNFLTISAGVAASYRMDFIDNGAKNGTRTYGIPYEWTIESEGRIEESLTFFSLYGSLTHDIRLADRIYLSLNYRFHQGLNTTVRETVRFTANPGQIEGDITRRINGTSNALNIGLKIRVPD